MATNKNATIRYQALNQCFQNIGRKYYIEDLIDKCNEALSDLDPGSSGVKRRQIFDDMKFMKDSRGFNAPIESYREGKRTYYRYDDPSFSINNQPLNEQEAQRLKESLLALSRFKGLPQFEWIEEMTIRLEQSFSLSSEKQVMSFEDNPFLLGREHLPTLFNAIANEKVLKITYQPFKHDDPTINEIHPYYIKQYNNRWFLFGLDSGLGKVANMAIDRVIKIDDINHKYIHNTTINFDEYFDDIIGVTMPEDQKPEKILIKIDHSTWPYVKTKPLHGSQKTKEVNEEFTTIQIEVIPNYELESMILSYGEKMEVLQPEHLRLKIAERLKTALNLYW